MVVGFGNMLRHSHSLAFFIGSFSLLHPLYILFSWIVLIAYCTSLIIKQVETRNIYQLMEFVLTQVENNTFKICLLILSLILFLWRVYSIKINDILMSETSLNSVKRVYFKRVLLLHILASMIIASSYNLNEVGIPLLAISLSLCISDWSFLPNLFKVCLTIQASGYEHFDRKQFIRNHAVDAFAFLLIVKHVMIDHYMKIFVLTVGTYWGDENITYICRYVRTYLIFLLISGFSFVPALIRLQAGIVTGSSVSAFSLNSNFEGFRTPKFPVIGPRKRTASFSTNAMSGSIRAQLLPFKQIYSNLHYNSYLVFTSLLILLNCIHCGVYLAHAKYFELWNSLNIINCWLCVGVFIISGSIIELIKHSLVSNCICDLCILEKVSCPRRRYYSESSTSSTFPNDSLKNSASRPVPLKPECPPRSPSRRSSDGAIEKPLKPPCAVTSRTDDSKWISDLEDSEVLEMIFRGKLKTRELESAVGNLSRAVDLRRKELALRLANPLALERIPYCNYDYRPVIGQCCEEVIGYVPLPLGKVGPLLLDGQEHYIPMATTEGCLVASTNRGCRALHLSGGVRTAVFRDQMTRAPVVAFSSIREVVECIAWLESKQGFAMMRNSFNETSSHADLLSIFPNPSGRFLHLRFSARTGEAMGMNMVSKGTDRALRVLAEEFPQMQVISLSGNMCTDKKPAAINYIMGRGKSVLAEARLPDTVIRRIFHCESVTLAKLATTKHWLGSAMAGSPGMAGCNAHAANIVAALFAATGQDLAQLVDSSACLTYLEAEVDRKTDVPSLYISVTMPCLEVGTVGGGTRLPAQRACLEMLNLELEKPAEHLARLLAGLVVAGELSLLAALATNDLVEAHMRLNRASAVATANTDEEVVCVKEETVEETDELSCPYAKHSFM